MEHFRDIKDGYLTIVTHLCLEYDRIVGILSWKQNVFTTTAH